MSDQVPDVDSPANEIDLNANDEDATVASNQQQQEITKSKPKYDDDLFFSTTSDLPSHNSNNNNNNDDDDKKKQEDMDDIFTANKQQAPPSQQLSKEIKLSDDDEEEDPFKIGGAAAAKKAAEAAEANAATAAAAAAAASSLLSAQASAVVVKKTSSTNEQLNKFYDDDEEDEDKDQFINISLSEPSKVGEGMGSYVTYKITVKTNVKAFKSNEFTTNRRFSDFLNLYQKLKEKHLSAGRVLPPEPEKDMIGMAKVKMSKEDTTPVDFLEKRRSALERFLNRLARHKAFKFDPDFRDFLEISGDLPKATNTSALSGAGMLKMFKNVTDSVTKIGVKMDETDSWFDERLHQVENLYVQYKKLHSTIEVLYGWRKDLAQSTKEFAKSSAVLANSEEHVSMSRALQNLSDAYEKIDQIYLDQSNHDYFLFAELLKDYICLFDNIKEVFQQRIKLWSLWQKAEETLKAKNDAKAKLEAANKQDKIPAATAEVKDWEQKVEKSKEEFELISKNMKEELKRFDMNRIKEIRTELTKYLEGLLKSQELIVQVWEQYLPQVKAI